MQRAWIDILTPKQILFFKPLKDKLESLGFEVFGTERHALLVDGEYVDEHHMVLWLT